MSKTLDFAEGLPLPLDLVTQTIGLVARKGGGKTYGGTKLAEEMAGAGAQIVALDPIGKWWGLGLDASGKHPSGLPIYVFGGEHGHLPLTPDAGARVADLVVEKRISAVLDVHQFRTGERKRFAQAFAEQFFHRKKSQQTPVHLFVEEAQKFVPQQAGPDERGMLGAFEDIVRLGRNYGIGCTLITQRPQSVNKEALSQVEVLVTLQVNGVHERKAIAEWVQEQGADRGVVNELPSLQVGEAFLWSPGWLRVFKKIRINRKRTLDTSRTPSVGEKIVEPGKLSDLDVDALKTEWTQVTAAAEKDDPKALRRQVAQLTAQLTRSGGQWEAVAKEALGEVEKLKAELDRRPTAEAFASAHRALRIHHDNRRRVLGFLGEVRKFSAVAVDALEDQEVERMEREIAAADAQLSAANARREYSPARKPLHAVPSPPRAPAPAGNGHDPDGEIPPAAERMLTALAMRHPIPLTRRQLATLSKYGSVDGGGFRNTLSTLSSRGLVEKRGDLVTLSGDGLAYFKGAMPPPQSPEDLRAMWRAELPPAVQRLFDVVLERAPRAITRAELAAATGYEAVDGGGFRNTLSVLSSNGLIHKAGDEVRAVDELIGDG